MDLAMTRKLRIIIFEYKNLRPPYLSKKHSLRLHEPEVWAKVPEGGPEPSNLNLQTKTPILKRLYSSQLFLFTVSVTFKMSNLSYLIVLLDKIQKLPEYEVNLDYYTNDIDYNEDTVHTGKQGYEKIDAVFGLSNSNYPWWAIPFQLHTKLSVTYWI